jgi:DNA-directed RNA polymerase subunit RPC12/RpoP
MRQALSKPAKNLSTRYSRWWSPGLSDLGRTVPGSFHYFFFAVKIKMYFIPQPYKCNKCNHEFEWSESVSHPLMEYKDEKGITHPTCPNCWNSFLKTLGYGEVIKNVQKPNNAA